jgi:hypothetical protein
MTNIIAGVIRTARDHASFGPLGSLLHLECVGKERNRDVLEVAFKVGILAGQDLLLEAAIALDSPKAFGHFCHIRAQAGGMAQKSVVGSVLLANTDTTCRGCLGKSLTCAYAKPDRYKVFAFTE